MCYSLFGIKCLSKLLKLLLFILASFEKSDPVIFTELLIVITTLKKRKEVPKSEQRV